MYEDIEVGYAHVPSVRRTAGRRANGITAGEQELSDQRENLEYVRSITVAEKHKHHLRSGKHRYIKHMFL